MKFRHAALLAAVALSTVLFAGTAQALPTYSGVCSGCHSSSSSISVTAAPVSNASATTTNYLITVTNSSNAGSHGYAVYNGSTRVTAALGTGTTIALTNGTTYTIYGCGNNASASQIYASISVRAAPITDTTAPTTASDAKPVYTSSAMIHLSASDNVGGSGVAHTYYVLDSGTQTEGTTVSTSVVGSHTLEFWSVDVAGNAETPHKFADFSVVAPVPDTTAPVTTSDAKASYVGSASIKLVATDNVGGSGVAHTYYVLDFGTQTEGTTVTTSVVGTHTLEFWSVDASGNAETPHNYASFEVTAAPVVTSHTVIIRINLRKANYRKLTATLRNTTTGAVIKTTVDKRGIVFFGSVPSGTYRFTVTGKKFSFRARTITVGTSNIAARFK